MKLKIYMGYDRKKDRRDILIFAHSAKEARRVGWPVMRGFYSTKWVEMGVERMRVNLEYLYEDADAVKLKADVAHANDSPRVCPNCKQWGGGRPEGGTCTFCCGD